MGKTFKDCGFKKDWRNKNKKKFKKDFSQKKRFTDAERHENGDDWKNFQKDEESC